MIVRPLRSVLFLPAGNPRAVEKARTLAADAVVLDLEDATGPEHKDYARASAVQALTDGGFGERTVVVRVNALDTRWGADDLEALRPLRPDAVLAPKVGSPADVRDYADRLPEHAQLWAMIETSRGVLALREIAASSERLTTLVVGTNDLSKDMKRPIGPDRRALHTALSLAVLSARACGLQVVDGVYNALEDTDGLQREAEEGRAFGFDGKSLIHPSQIETANRAFSPSDEETAWARAVVDAYADPANAEAGAIRLKGAMVERLHLEQARRTLRLAETV